MDTNFIIPFRLDSEDRLKNLFRALIYLRYKFPSTKILIINQDINDSNTIIPEYLIKYNIQNVEFVDSGISGPFYKSKLINIGLNKCETDVVVIHDCDVLIPKEQLELSVKMCYDEYSVVYPYSNPQYDVLQNKFQEFEQDYDFKKIEYSVPPRMMLHQHSTNNYPVIGYAPGFCITINKKKLGKYAFYNEDYIGWGCEDGEYIFKMDFLNVKMTRVYGPVFHFEHERTETQFSDATSKNYKLYEKTIRMAADELKKYYGVE